MKNNNNNSFWIAYADLMAGLMFIFILLIGMMVVKYVFSQQHLDSIKTELDKQKEVLAKNRADLTTKEQIVSELGIKLQKAYDDLQLQHKRKKELEGIISTHVKNEEKLSQTYTKAVQELQDTSDKLNKILDDVDEKDRKIIILLNDLSKKEIQIKELNDKYKLVNDKISNVLNQNNALVGKLQTRLDGISLDSTGTLSLPSTVLFDSGAYMLKQNAKEELKSTLTKYFDAILNDKDIYNNIENIIIEGHTDSDGSYIYNLELSQKRAYEVMSFIYSFNSDKRLQKLLMASGRSYSAPIIVDGKEDKEASRRIEIKIIFSTKNINKNINELLKTAF